MKFSSALLSLLTVGSAVSSSTESIEHLHDSVTMTSEDVTSARGADATVLDIPRALKKAKGSAKETKAPNSGKKKEPKVPKSKNKVPKSSKGSANASPSPPLQTTSQPSLNATDDPCVVNSIYTQKDALLDLKAGFKNGGTQLIDWNSDTEPCSDDASNWGDTITCNSDGQVTEIVLSALDLEGTISPLIGCPTSLVSSLTFLNFRTNSLSGKIPTELKLLTSLSYLNFRVNGFTGNIPVDFQELTSLTYLNFNENDLTGNIPTELGLLTNLTELGFYDNNFTGNIPMELGLLTNLGSLDFGTNRFSGNIPTVLGQLTSLTQLYFDGNDLVGSMPTGICDLFVSPGSLSILEADKCDPIEVTCTCCTNICV